MRQILIMLCAVLCVGCLAGCLSSGSISNYQRAVSRVESPGTIAPPQPLASEYKPFVADVVSRERMMPKDVHNGNVSTFSIDVDTASYASIRSRIEKQNELPACEEVRVEELVNYFSYDDPTPTAESTHPVAFTTEVGACPWAPANRLVRIGLKAKELAPGTRPASNIVLLIDTSRSMRSDHQFKLVKESLRILVNQLDARDTVSIVTYAGDAKALLEGERGNSHRRITDVIDRLRTGGSTNGGAGIRLAYDVAHRNKIEGGNNRIILCTDGAFNSGCITQWESCQQAEREATDGTVMTVLRFGDTSNDRHYNRNAEDKNMEQIAQRGGGNYHYIDGREEACKVLHEQISGNLVTVAEDVKLQVFFNPALVASWQLIGYENRRLNAEDFNNDAHDAGDIGAGHSVVALYEIVPHGAAVDANPYMAQDPKNFTPVINNTYLMRLRMRYKKPGAIASHLQEVDIEDRIVPVEATSTDFRWSAAVAGFGLKLRGDANVNKLSWSRLRRLAKSAAQSHPSNRRAAFIRLTRDAENLQRKFAYR